MENKTGEQQERTEWHKTIFFGKLAEIAGQYLKKGSQVYIEGSLHTSKYTDKQGIDRYSTDIIATEMQMLSGNERINNQTPAQPSSVTQQNRQVDSSQFDVSDDIPF